MNFKVNGRTKSIYLVKFIKCQNDARIEDFPKKDVLSYTLVKSSGDKSMESLLTEPRNEGMKINLYRQGTIFRRCPDKIF